MHRTQPHAGRQTVSSTDARTLIGGAERFSLGWLLGIGKRNGWSRALSGALVAAACSPALAGPQGAQVVRGDVSISHNGAQTLIRAGNNSIINYKSFDIGASESVRFIQPSATSRVLNRITTAAPTKIDGSLTSNGIVYIVNPAGVWFGKGATVNVAGIYAAAGRLSNQDFLKGNNHFTDMQGGVTNEGTIEARTTALVGKHVENLGSIVASGGTVMMASGQDVMLGERSGNIFVRIKGEADAGASGAATTNSGTVNAGGGRVVLGAGDIYAMAIQTTGDITAKSISVQGQGNGEVSVSGRLSAKDQGKNQTGGSIEVLGKKVALTGATLDASGKNGGGTINVGGDYQGQGNRLKADRVFVSADSTLDVSAKQGGSGGQAIVWSEEFTRVYGAVDAAGSSGQGGFVETSSRGLVDLDPVRVDTSAKSGKGGNWLIDPQDLTINNANNHVTATNPFEPTGNNSTLDVARLIDPTTGALTNGSTVTITTHVSGSGSGGSGNDNGDITVATGITTADSRLAAGQSSTLVMIAARHIIFSNGSDVQVASAGHGHGTLNLDLRANDSRAAGDNNAANLHSDGDTGGAASVGDVEIFSHIRTNGGSFTAKGVNFVTDDGSAHIGTLDLGGASNGDLSITADASATSHAISFASTATVANAHNVTLNSGTITLGTSMGATGAVAVTGTGAVTINGNVTGSSIAVHSGTSNTGNTTFGAGVTLDAASIVLQAGSLNGTDTTATVNAVTNTPHFQNGSATVAPSTFTIESDAAIADGQTPAATQLGNGTLAGMAYTLKSDGAGVSVGDETKFPDAALTLDGHSGVVINTGANTFSTRSLNVLGVATLGTNGNASQAVTTTGNAGMTFQNVVLASTSNVFTAGAHAVSMGDVTGGAGGENFTVSASGGTISFGLAGGVDAGGGKLGAVLLTANTVTAQGIRTDAASAASSITINGGLVLAGTAVSLDTTNGGLTGAAVQINGAVTRDNVTAPARALSIKAGDGNVGITGNIGTSAVGGALDGFTVASAGTTTTLGGNIFALGVSVTGTDINFNGNVSSTAGNLIVNNTGTATFLGTATVGGGGSFQQLGNGVASLLNLHGDVTVSGGGSISIASPTVKLFTNNQTLDSGAGTIAIGQQLDLGNNSATFKADEINFGGGAASVLNGGGTTLTLRASGASTNIEVNGTLNPTGLHIDANDLAAIGTAPAQLVIGVDNSANIVTIHGTTFGTPLTVFGGAVGVDTADLSAPSLRLGNSNLTTVLPIDHDISTTAGLLRIDGVVGLTGARTFTSAGAGVTLNGTINGDNGLTVANGGLFTDNSAMTLQGNFLQNTANAVTVTKGIDVGDHDIHFTGAVTVGGTVSEFAAGTGHLQFDSALAINTAGVDFTLSGDQMTFSGPVSAGAANVSITLRQGHSNENLSINTPLGSPSIELDTPLANFVDGFQRITIGRNDGTGSTTVGSATFSDPVRILGHSVTVLTGAAITGTDDASVSIQAGAGGFITLSSATIQTIDQAISLTGNVSLFGASSLETSAAGNGAAITITGTIDGTTPLSDSLAFNVAGHGSASDVHVTGAVGGGGIAPLIAINASHNVDFDGAVHAINLATTNTGVAHFHSTVAADTGFTQTGAGSVQFDGDVSTVNSNLSVAGSTTIGGALEVATGAGLMTFHGMTVGSNALTLTGDIDLAGGSGSVTGSGQLLLRSGSTSDDILVGFTSPGFGLDFDGTDINALHAGFAGITIGRSAGLNRIIFASGPGVFHDPVTFFGLGGGGGGGLIIDGNIVGDTNSTFTFNGLSVVALGGSEVATGGGLIQFNNGLNLGVNALTLTGNIDFAGGAGSVTGSGLLTLRSASSSDAILVGASAGSFGLTLSSTDIDALANTFTNGIVIGRAGPATNTITIGNTGASTFKNTVTFDGPGGISLASNLSASGSGAFTFNGNTTVGSNLEVATAGGLIKFNNGVVVGTRTLTLTGDIDFSGGSDSVTGTGSVVMRSASTSDGILVGTHPGSFGLTLSGADIDALAGNFTGVIIGRASPATNTLTIGTGSGTFKNPTTFQAPGGISTFGTLAAGAPRGSFIFDTTSVTLGGDIITQGTAIDFQSDVVVGGAALVTLNANGGNIHFGGTITGQTDLATGLTLSTGGPGTITLDGVVGAASHNLADITFNGAATVTTTDITAGTIHQTALSGTATYGLLHALEATPANTAIDLQAGTVVLTDDVTSEGGKVSVTSIVHLDNGSGVTISSNGGDITLTGQVTSLAGEDLHLDAGLTGNVQAAGVDTGAGDLGVAGHNITLNGTVSSGNFDAAAEADLTILGDVSATAGGILAQAGQSTLGHLVLGDASHHPALSGSTIDLVAGDGTGASTIDAASFDPTFTGPNGTGLPTHFSFTQDAAIDASANMPTTAQFTAGVAGLDYRVRSTNGTVTLNDHTRIDGTNLTVQSSTAGAGGITFADAGSALTTLASFHAVSGVTFSSSLTATAADITLDGPAATSGTIELKSSGHDINFGSTLSVSGSNTDTLTLTARDMDLAGNVTPTGGVALVFQTFDTHQDIFLGGTNTATGPLHLSIAEINRLGNGFRSITIGGLTADGTINIEDDVTFQDPLVLRSPHTGGAIKVDGLVTGTDDASVTILGSGGTTTLTKGIVTSGQAILIQDSVIIAGPITLFTALNAPAGADITITGTVDAKDETSGLQQLTLAAGTGNIDVRGDIGHDGQRLQALAAFGGSAGLGHNLKFHNVRTLGNQQYFGPLLMLGDLKSEVQGIIKANAGVVITQGTGTAGDVRLMQTAGHLHDDIIIVGDTTADAAVRSIKLNAGLGSVTTGNLGISGNELGTIEVIGANMTVLAAMSTGTQSYGDSTSLTPGDSVLNLGVGGTGGDLLSDQSVSVFANTLLNNSSTINGTNVEFSGTVKSQAGQGFNLTLTSGAAFFDDSVGGAAAGPDVLSNLTVSGGTVTFRTNASSVSTTFGQTYSSAVALAHALTMNAGADVTFTNGVDTDQGVSVAAQSLTVNTPGVTRFPTGAGVNKALLSLSTDAGGSSLIGGNIHTTGQQHFGDAVTLANNVSFTGTDLTFDSSIDSDGSGARTLDLNATGQITVTGDLGAQQDLGVITTTSTGTQTYSGNVLLGGDSTFTGNGLHFAGLINSVHGAHFGMLMDAGTGALAVDQAVGATDSLANLTARSGLTTTFNGGVHAVGALSFGGSTGINFGTGSGQTLYQSDTADLTINDALTLSGDVKLETSDSSHGITTLGAIDGAHNLVLDAGPGTIHVHVAIGANTPLASLSATASQMDVVKVKTVGDQLYTGALRVAGDLETTDNSSAGDIHVTGALTLAAVPPTSGTPSVTFTTAHGAVTLDGAIDSSNQNNGSNLQALTIHAGGLTTINGEVGQTLSLASLAINDDATGTGTTVRGSIILNTDKVTTSAAQTYGTGVALSNDIVFAGTNLTFGSTVNGAHALRANMSGVTSFGGAVSGLTQIITDDSGKTTIADDITTTNGMIFGDQVTIAKPSGRQTVTVDGGTGTVRFKSTIDAATSGSGVILKLLSNNSADGTLAHLPFWFGGDIGGAVPLGIILGADRTTAALGATAVFADKNVVDATDPTKDTLKVRTTGGKFTIKASADGFRMGRGQKLTSFQASTTALAGHTSQDKAEGLIINVASGGDAVLGDLTSLGDISITADHITLLTRAAGSIALAQGGSIVQDAHTDFGVDYVASGSFFFSSKPEFQTRVTDNGVTKDFAAPTFSQSNNGGHIQLQIAAKDLQQNADVAIKIADFSGEVQAGVTDALFKTGDTVNPLDLRALGTAEQQNVTPITPRDPEVRQGSAPVTIDESLRKELDNMGITLRGDLSVEQIIEFMVGRALYEDNPRVVVPMDKDYQITINRLTRTSVETAIEAYHKLIQNEKGEPRTEQIYATLTESWSGYSERVHEKDGAAYRAFLEDQGQTHSQADVDALTYLKLTHDFLDKLDSLGLSPAEANVPKNRLLDSLRPDSMDKEQLLAAVGVVKVSAKEPAAQ